MAIHKLTDRAVAAKPPGLYGDGGSLYLKVTPSQTRSWVFRYWHDGRRHALGLGPYPDISLAQARIRAEAQRRLRLDGQDPMAAKRARIAEQRAVEAKGMTFEDCATAYVKAHKAGWRDEREAKLWTASLRDHVYPTIGKLPVDAIDLPLVLRVIEPMWQTKTATASRVRRRIENILDWATVRGHRSGDNPARWKGHLDQVLPKERKVAQVEHHEALPYPAVGAFMVELRSDKKLSARALEFSILTAARVGEVVGATWQEIDFKGRTWTIPAERMKADREHRVPLSDAALALLEALPRTGARVFPVSRTIVWYAAAIYAPRSRSTAFGRASATGPESGPATRARLSSSAWRSHAASGIKPELAYRRVR